MRTRRLVGECGGRPVGDLTSAAHAEAPIPAGASTSVLKSRRSVRSLGTATRLSIDPTMRGIGFTTLTARIIGQLHTFHGRAV